LARPRVFVSSTFYDLRHVRADLEHFIREVGYEPILHERGLIPYGAEKKLEEYAYQEVGLSDLLVSVVGGRFGAVSNQPPYSVSQSELKRALELGKPVHIFLERTVQTEYNTYTHNKGNAEINYHYVDDVRVFGFIEELYALPNNNPIATFESSADITNYLREQWAGLFQRFLREQRLRQEMSVLEGMQSTVTTLNQLVTFLTEERRNTDVAIQDILLSNHPAFEAARKAISAPYRMYFTNRAELLAYLRARNWIEVEKAEWDSPQYEEWMLEANDEASYSLLKIRTGIFEPGGKLKLYTASEWKPSWISSAKVQRPAVKEIDPDEIPF
jgi:hypothetical protein